MPMRRRRIVVVPERSYAVRIVVRAGQVIAFKAVGRTIRALAKAKDGLELVKRDPTALAGVPPDMVLGANPVVGMFAGQRVVLDIRGEAIERAKVKKRAQTNGHAEE